MRLGKRGSHVHTGAAFRLHNVDETHVQSGLHLFVFVLPLTQRVFEPQTDKAGSVTTISRALCQVWLHLQNLKRRGQRRRAKTRGNEIYDGEK